MRLGKFDEALEGYRRVTETVPRKRDPGDGMLRYTLADAYCELGELEKADKLYQSILKTNGDSSQIAVIRYRGALCQLGLKEIDLYSATCKAALSEQGQPPGASYWTAWTCVLSPKATDNWQAVVDLSSNLTSEGMPEPIAKLTHGAALFRAGEYSQAREMLSSLAEGWNEAESSRAYALWYLALNEASAGDTEAAKRWAQLAAEATKAELQQAPIPAWNQRLTLKLLAQEFQTRPHLKGQLFD